MMQAAMPHLIETQGNVVNIASTASLVGQAYTAPYAATKTAVLSLTKSLAMEHINRSEEHTSELQSLMRISYAVFCLKKKKQNIKNIQLREQLLTHKTQNKRKSTEEHIE